MSILNALNNNLALQMQNIMGDNPSEEELKAISEQTKQLTTVSKQIIDNHRLMLDAIKFGYETGDIVRLDGVFYENTKAIGDDKSN